MLEVSGPRTSHWATLFLMGALECGEHLDPGIDGGLKNRLAERFVDILGSSTHFNVDRVAVHKP